MTLFFVIWFSLKNSLCSSLGTIHFNFSHFIISHSCWLDYCKNISEKHSGHVNPSEERANHCL